MIKLARVFGDYMVLQRNQPIAIWGESDTAEEIVVSLNGDVILTAEVPQGPFTLLLPAQHEMVDAELQIGNVSLKSVDIGEVWVAGGQSNMEFLLKFVKDSEEELASADDEHLRMYTVGQYSFAGQRELGYKSWNPWDRWIRFGEEGTDAFSAVGTFFAKQLRKEGVPVGILNCSWGGTKIFAWTDTAYQTGDMEVSIRDFQKMNEGRDMRRYNIIKDYVWPSRYGKPAPGKDFGEVIVRHTYLPSEAMKIMGALEAPQDPDPNAPAAQQMAALTELLGGPMTMEDIMAVGPGNENEPGALYDNMVSEIAGYSAKGVIWYQGCSDEDHSDLYDRMMATMIACWRDSWKKVNPSQDKLPFLFTQLAPFGVWLACTSENYPAQREAQQRAADSISDAWMAVITDVGSIFDIHPKDKKPVGDRLAALAQHYVYGKTDVPADAPREQNVTRTASDTIAIDFAYGEGLHIVAESFDGYNGFTLEQILAEQPAMLPPITGGVNGLEILADGQTVKEAACRTEGGTLLVTSEELAGAGTIEVRFASTPFYQVNLYNGAEIPARPFIAESK